MKKRNIIILIALLAVAVIVAVLLIGKPASTGEPAEQPAEQSQPEQQTQPAGEKTTPAANEKNETEEQDEKSEEPDPSPTPTPWGEEPAKTSYELFMDLSPELKDEFLHSFDDYDAFYDWLVAAQAEYSSLHPEIEIGADGVIDLSKLG